ncbi:MAG: Maf family protein [Gammaproteobacteria bacterium]
MKRVILASQSPRRAALLSQLGVDFTQQFMSVDETPLPDEEPAAYVRRVCMAKAAAVAVGLTQLVIAADTSVVCDGTILGKPENREDFVKMMHTLSDREHDVMTAVTVRSVERQDTFLNISQVQFRSMTMPEINAYWETGEPIDKAGGYGIQGLGAAFVSRIVGSYSAVMGLPLNETAAMLTDFGVPWALNPCR